MKQPSHYLVMIPGSFQLNAGKVAGVEAASSLSLCSDATLLVDASF